MADIRRRPMRSRIGIDIRGASMAGALLALAASTDAHAATGPSHERATPTGGPSPGRTRAKAKPAPASAAQAARGLRVQLLTGQRMLAALRAPALELAPGAGYDTGGSRLVRDLQRLLTRSGDAPGPIDGYFGPLTEAAVIRFQASRGLRTDGVAGPKTLAVLTARMLELSVGVGDEPGGSRMVRGLQWLLERAGDSPGSIDGRFGPLTEAAVMRFQAAHGLHVDGIAGPVTIAALAPRRPRVLPRRPSPRPALLARRSRGPVTGARHLRRPAAVANAAPKTDAASTSGAAKAARTHHHAGAPPPTRPPLLAILAVILALALQPAVWLYARKRRSSPPDEAPDAAVVVDALDPVTITPPTDVPAHRRVRPASLAAPEIGVPVRPAASRGLLVAEPAGVRGLPAPGEDDFGDDEHDDDGVHVVRALNGGSSRRGTGSSGGTPVMVGRPDARRRQ